MALGLLIAFVQRSYTGLARLAVRPLIALLFAGALIEAQVLSPEAHFGHSMGADRELLDWEPIVSYFRALEKTSNRIRVTELGKTQSGRPLIAAFLSSEENLNNLPRLQAIQQGLADARSTSRPEAEKLSTEGKTVVMITCSLHSTEVASTFTGIELAFSLLTRDNESTRKILDNTVIILVPSLNPDGIDIVARWYRRTLGTSYEGTSPPELYNKYVGHDNNRDWYMFTQTETRLVVANLYNVWHPQVVYDLHQQGMYTSRIFVPPWMDPIDPNVDPILMQLSNAIGAQMASDLTAAGKTGVAINATYDFWTPARHYAAYHGGVRILSESASVQLATPVNIRQEELASTALGFSPRNSTWNHLEPWKGGEWTLRNIVEYQLVAANSLLTYAAANRESLLRSFYTVSERSIAKTSPYAFVMPKRQSDGGAARILLETLVFGAVEVQQLSEQLVTDEHTFEPGSYVISMQQPNSSFAKTLLERQNYPDLRSGQGTGPRIPYDVTAQSLPLLMGLTVVPVERAFSTPLTRAILPFPRGEDPTALSASDTDSWTAVNRAWDDNQPVFRNSLNGDFAVKSAPLGSWKRVGRPRVGLYHSLVPNVDEGWTRWLLDRFGFKYTPVGNQEIRSASLNASYDVLVFADTRPDVLNNGYAKGQMPEEFTGGIGREGTKNLNRFAANGGTIVFLNESSIWALQNLELPVENVLDGVGQTDFYAPGSLLNVRLAVHPLTLGMPRTTSVWFESGPAFTVLSEGSKLSAATAVATYSTRDVLASGWLVGEKRIANKAAVFDVPLGKGHVVLFGIRPQYRGQSYATFKMLFNSFLLSQR